MARFHPKKKNKASIWSTVSYVVFLLIFSSLIVFVVMNMSALINSPVPAIIDFNRSDSDINFDNIPSLENNLRNYPEQTLSRAIRYIGDDKITGEQKQVIDTFILDAIESWNEYSSKSKKDNETLRRGLWYTYKAKSLLEYYAYQNCFNSTTNYYQSLDSSLYYLPITYKNTYSEIANFAGGYERSIDVGKTSTSFSNVDKTQREIKVLKAVYSFYYDRLDSCHEFESEIKAEFSSQKKAFIGKVIAIILIVLFSFLLKRIVFSMKRLFIVDESSPNSFFDNIWSPDNLNEETIKAILKLNTSITIFIAIATLLLSQLNMNSSFIILTLVLVSSCVVLVIGSILLGLMSISLKDEKDVDLYRMWSYKLFIISLLLFTFFVVEIILLLFLGSTRSVVVNVAKDFVNQTIS